MNIIRKLDTLHIRYFTLLISFNHLVAPYIIIEKNLLNHIVILKFLEYFKRGWYFSHDWYRSGLNWRETIISSVYDCRMFWRDIDSIVLHFTGLIIVQKRYWSKIKLIYDDEQITKWNNYIQMTYYLLH